MKKIVAILLCTSMLCTLGACGERRKLKKLEKELGKAVTGFYQTVE